jgi:proline iminopeptidase
VTTARQRYFAFRRTAPHAPKLERQTVRARGLAFAVFSSPPVDGATPLLCVNGGLIVDHAMLWPALSPLAAGRQLILYDQRGRGESEAPPDPSAARIEDDAADVPALRRALGIRRWDVLGHSWGGGIAMLAASQDPAGVRRLVLVDAVGPTSAWMAPLRVETLARANDADRAVLAGITDAMLGMPDPAVHLAHLRASYEPWFVDRTFASTFPMPKAASPTGTAALARLRRDGYDWRDRVRAIAAPTLVLHGDGDPLPPSVADDVVAAIPGARTLLLPHSGHFPFWEAPAEFFAATSEFLA